MCLVGLVQPFKECLSKFQFGKVVWGRSFFLLPTLQAGGVPVENLFGCLGLIACTWFARPMGLLVGSSPTWARVVEPILFVRDLLVSQVFSVPHGLRPHDRFSGSRHNVGPCVQEILRLP